MSTVSGLGSIPGHWRVERARWLLSRQQRRPSSTDGVVTAFRDGQVTLRANRRLEGFTEAIQEIGYQGVREGDLVIHSMDGFAGAIGVSDSDGKASPVVHAYTATSGVDLRYMAYVLRQMALTGYISSLAKGIRERSTAFDPATLANVLLPIPPLEEQRRIADFLDGEAARIARMELLQRTVLAKLDERDQAVIDLEVDRLETEFGAAPLRRSVRRIEQGSSPQCDNIPAEEGEWGVLKVSSVKHGQFWAEENKRLPDALTPERRYEVRPGDLLVTRANTPALVGAAAVVPDVRSMLLLCDKIFRIDVSPELDRQFVVLVSRGTKIRDLCAAASHGTSQSMANLKTEEIKGWPIPKADFATQREMVKRVVEQHAVTGMLRMKVSRKLDLLVERRQAMITSAVTGKIDVTTARRAGV